ncbi:MAG TPA: transcription antitermination factor NusB [bacterium]|nr:transcription antitermination factor NusB [bacterium]
MGKRRKARELVMQFLYQHDFTGESGDDTLALFLREHEMDAETSAFCTGLIRGTIAKKSEIDAIITKYVDNWDISRIATVDLNVIRMAIYEMLNVADIPPIVSINEAVDIAKKYSTAESGKFVNGILDKIKKELVDAHGKKPS